MILSSLLSLGLLSIQLKYTNGFRVSSSSSSPAPLTRRHHVIDPPVSELYATTSWKNPFEGLFSGTVGSGQKTANSKQQRQEEEATRQRLITELLEKCLTLPRYSQQKRASIEETMRLLAPLSPIQQTAASPALQKEWKLLWTTEKEINFFYDWNFSNDIRQTISNGTRLQNMIFFKTTGFFGVQGRLSIPDDKTGIRTDFVFESATLNLGPRWGEYTLPPVGAGWFDTIYLDDTLRIDTNSRNDILICTAAA